MSVEPTSAVARASRLGQLGDESPLQCSWRDDLLVVPRQPCHPDTWIVLRSDHTATR